MLVLSRKKDEDIYVGDDVMIKVLDIRGDKVRLGFEAPPHVVINRGEVRDAIERSHIVVKVVTSIQGVTANFEASLEEARRFVKRFNVSDGDYVYVENNKSLRKGKIPFYCT